MDEEDDDAYPGDELLTWDSSSLSHLSIPAVIHRNYTQISLCSLSLIPARLSLSLLNMDRFLQGKIH
jgi:hypothetical protein